MEEKDLKREQEENKEVLEGEETGEFVEEAEETPEEAAAKAAAMEAEVEEAFSDENLEGKPDKKDLAIADLTDRLKRSMAEFDNFRKRSEKEKANGEDGKKDYQLLKQEKISSNLEITMQKTKIYKILELICNILENVKIVEKKLENNEKFENIEKKDEKNLYLI